MMKLAAIAGLILLSSASAYSVNKTTGAVYFLTNEVSGNFIVSSAIGADGKLTLGQAFSVGGSGANGITGPTPQPDPLFSQGVITVSGNQVFTVNPGSGSLAIFDIDPCNPTNLSIVGKPVNSGGDFPVSVAVSKRTKQVCVLNTGTVNGVSCFKQLGTSIIPIPGTTRSLGLNQTNPATGVPNTASDVIFNHDETKLIAAVKGTTTPPVPGYLAVWDVNPFTGALSPEFTKVTLPAGGALPFSITPIEGKNAVLVSDLALGYEIFDFTNGTSAAFPIANQIAICWSTFSKKTGNYYIIDSGRNIISEVSVDPVATLKADTVMQYTMPAGSILLDTDVASIGGNDYLYVLAPGTQSIIVLALPGPLGATTIQNFAFADGLAAAGVKTDVFALVGLATYTA
ncbi:hypothetical protein M422DRAFT_782374 [Sphaerobolus stellatus SS14]|uniref:3-carboxymuconate cyclase n=1 Tax=Sphaerobolus stellatus (strain SS14) TaxID=990650 RepID=A0A0C9V2R7_SPHS4|nr:hypothetical protein M422DRAFT_782374 [Sphaerobolus stellatus SS14]